MVSLRQETATDFQGSLRHLIDLSITLSAECKLDRLLEQILHQARNLTKTDDEVLYLYNVDDNLKLLMDRNSSILPALNETNSYNILYPLLQLQNQAKRQPNHHSMAICTALQGAIVSVDDACDTKDFDFVGAKNTVGYRSKLFQTMLLWNYQGNVSGVLQLINIHDAKEYVILLIQENRALIDMQEYLLKPCIQMHRVYQ